RWILSAGRSHAGSVGYKYIGTRMKLIPFIEQGGFGIVSHPYSTHFVDVQSGCSFIVPGSYIGDTGFRKHFLHLFQIILDHFLVVVVALTSAAELTATPVLSQLGIERYHAGFCTNSLTHHMGAVPPGSIRVIEQTGFEFCSYTASVSHDPAMAAEPRSVPPQEIAFPTG